jgi:nucleoside-diphosphate kinase
MTRTFAMVKPDGVQRGLVGEVVARFERRGLKLVAMKLLRIPRELAERHYGEHKGKPFYEPLVEFITCGPVVAMVLEGENAVQAVRDMMGKTDPQKSAPGTIRADLGMSMSRNVIHGSDSEGSAEREIGLFFRPDELVAYARIDEAWLYGK